MSIGTNLTLNRRRRRAITFSWMAALSLLLIGLIYWEKTALLYILATLGLCALLAIVGLADLGGTQETAPESPNTDSGRGIARTQTKQKMSGR